MCNTSDSQSCHGMLIDINNLLGKQTLIVFINQFLKNRIRKCLTQPTSWADSLNKKMFKFVSIIKKNIYIHFYRVALKSHIPMIFATISFWAFYQLFLSQVSRHGKLQPLVNQVVLVWTCYSPKADSSSESSGSILLVWLMKSPVSFFLSVLFI